MLESVQGLLGLSAAAVWSLGALMVITRRLVWYTDLRRQEQRAEKELARERQRGDKWEGLALRALGVAEKMSVHAETVTEALAAPLADGGDVS